MAPPRPQPSVEKVFLSSTCFDLIDARAELEQELRKMGLVPILSDRLTSDFSVSPLGNSIETCLANVRDCATTVILLSQRYGPSLRGAGFPDISATHLEYREARKFKRRILFYVRDRLEAEYAIWRKNPDTKRLTWVHAKDVKIFSFLDEHRKLTKTRGKTPSNWFWTFRDSVDLRARLRKDLQAIASPALLKELIVAGRMAHIAPLVRSYKCLRDKLIAEMSVRNVGNVAAIAPNLAVWSDEEDLAHFTPPTLLPGDSFDFSFTRKIVKENRADGLMRNHFDCCYAVPEGHYIGDEFSVEHYFPPSNDVWYHDHQKRYYHADGITFSGRDNKDRFPDAPFDPGV